MAALTEEAFRRRRELRWRELARLVRDERGGRVDEAKLFRLYELYRLTALDLAWARVNSGADLVRELNALVASAHAVVDAPPEGTWRRLWRFYAFGLPMLVVRLRGYVWVAALALLLGGILGLVAVAWGGTRWASVVIPPHLIPLYHGRHVPLRLGVETASAIYVNNILVAFRAFGAGIAAGIWTLYILFQNGLLIGGLYALFLARGLSLTFWALILPHGVLELFAVSLAGAGGLRLGWSWLRPGDISRGAALRQAGGEAVRLLLGVIPLLGIAALIEGLVTPSSLDPWLKLGVAALGAAGLVAYIGRGRPGGIR